MKAAFDRRRQTMVRLLNDIPGVTCPVPEGAFYAYPSVKGVLGKTLRGRTPQTSAELAELVLDEVGVAVVPGEAFGTPGYFRLSYALGDADLEKGVLGWRPCSLRLSRTVGAAPAAPTARSGWRSFVAP
jgi:aspartate/methionine/tyrosine aminotransferase